MRARTRFAVVAALLLCLGPAARAAITLHEGTLSTANQTVVAAVGWDGIPESNKKPDNGFEISYEVTLDPDAGLVRYVYGLSGVDGSSLSKALSHFIVETSPNFTPENIFGGTTSHWELRSDLESVHKTWAGETNTAGLKWDTTCDPLTATYTIVTDRLPMLGTFYAKSGNGTYARANGAFYVPDTTGAQSMMVPEPSALCVIAIPLALLAVRRHRRSSAA